MTLTGLVRSTTCLAGMVYTGLARASELDSLDAGTRHLLLVLFLLAVTNFVCDVVRYVKLKHPVDDPVLVGSLSLIQIVARLMLDMSANPEHGLRRSLEAVYQLYQ